LFANSIQKGIELLPDSNTTTTRQWIEEVPVGISSAKMRDVGVLILTRYPGLSS
jgi:hypothetical protein